MDQKWCVVQPANRRPTRRNRIIALALVLGIAGAAQSAGACSIEADGPSAYERVKARLKELYERSPSVSFQAFKSIDTAVDDKCKFTLKGPFQVKKKGHVAFLKFEAELVRNGGAPMGWQILKLEHHT